MTLLLLLTGGAFPVRVSHSQSVYHLVAGGHWQVQETPDEGLVQRSDHGVVVSCHNGPSNLSLALEYHALVVQENLVWEMKQDQEELYLLSLFTNWLNVFKNIYCRCYNSGSYLLICP